MARVTLQKTVTTRGGYIGEEGIGYGFVTPPSQTGDFSAVCRGHLQGYDEQAAGELDGRLEIIDVDEFGIRAFARDGQALVDVPASGLDAEEARDLGYLKIVVE